MDKFSKLKLAYTIGVGPKKFLKVINNADGVHELIAKSEQSFDDNLIKGLLEFDSLVLGEERFPELLTHIPDSPIILYYKGEPRQTWQNFVSIVGTRKPTNYGVRYAEILTRELVSRGYGTVSGLAYGIDTVVHKSTLEAGGITVAVLGTKIESAHPIANSRLYNEICKTGLIFSELTRFSKWTSHYFAARNRIIAGLTPSTIVIEAPERSGALITAHLAFDYNRDVFAIPGNLDQLTMRGNNRIIKINKARLLDSICDDFFPNLNQMELFGRNDSLSQREEYGLKDSELQILKLLSDNDLDEIQNSLKINSIELFSILTKLELSGFVVKQLDGRYTLTSKLTL